jgi:hypothetical protein
MTEKLKLAFAHVAALLALGAMAAVPLTAAAQPVAYAQNPGAAIKRSSAFPANMRYR